MKVLTDRSISQQEAFFVMQFHIATCQIFLSGLEKILILFISLLLHKHCQLDYHNMKYTDLLMIIHPV